MIYLADTSETGGGFRCVPGFLPGVAAADEWMRRRAAGAVDFDALPETSDFKPRTIAARRGDMVIWNSYMPHGSGENTDRAPRVCQYATMFPDPSVSAAAAAAGVAMGGKVILRPLVVL